jgi:hypothetical protein
MLGLKKWEERCGMGDLIKSRSREMMMMMIRGTWTGHETTCNYVVITSLLW